MRLVKKTVNQDDVSAYHLFYADGRGTPGTDLTFFDWPAPPEKRGTAGIVRTGLRVAGGREALIWWADRLREAGLSPEGRAADTGRMILEFEDPEGQRLALISDPSDSFEGEVWEDSPIPAEYQIRGLGPVTISVPSLSETESLLTGLLGMSRIREYRADAVGSPVVVFGMAGQGPASELHVAEDPDFLPARQGAGGVHHVAFRVGGREEYEAWNRRLQAFRIPSSGPVDRYYFRSLYFQEPHGILFELATDEPGFAVDEPSESLGESLALPPFLEPRRAEIEAGLKPLEPVP